MNVPRSMAVGLVVPFRPSAADLELRNNQLQAPRTGVGLEVEIHTYIPLPHDIVWLFIGCYSHGKSIKSYFAGGVALSFGFQIAEFMTRHCPRRTYQGLHTKIVTKGLRWGIILFIISEVFFFISEVLKVYTYFWFTRPIFSLNY
jgi:hypothetical protein